jgi:hypothetical protein
MKGIEVYSIEGDSGEYEFLTEGVELSKDIPGMCIEIGVRRGLGTKTIIDAVRQFCPGKTVIAVDPYGSIPYKPRDHMPECRLDYTNQMKAETLAALWSYVAENPVSFKYFDLTDLDFFAHFNELVPIYDLVEGMEFNYSFVHLDGPHGVLEVNHEIDWFEERMLKRAILIIDDITEDFIPIEKVEEHMGDRFECVKKGMKKGIWRKV